LLVDQDDPEKRIAELERQLADGMNSVSPPNQHQAEGVPPAGWYPDPGGAAFRRYWDGHEWTSATDVPTQPPPNVDTATPEDEPESSPGPKWSQPPSQERPNPVPPPPQGYPSYPGQPYPYPVAGWGVDPEAPYGRDVATGKPLSDKKAAVAGVLQLLFGVFGAGRFYIGSKAIAGCQLGLTIVGVVLAQVTSSSDAASGLVGLLLLVVAIWAFIDAIRMFTRSVTDGQGRKLS
jgi:TM2 domain-containing membrane protein YozV